MSNNKISKEIKERMDREFRQYWVNKRKLKQIEKSTTASTRTVLYCQERITYVESVIKRLKPFEIDVFYLIFKQGYDCIYCKTMKNIDKSTYYNIYNKAIKLLAEEWGEL